MTELTWKDAALRAGEAMAPQGPEGYYLMEPSEWLSWFMEKMDDSERCAGLGTTLGMWEMLSELLEGEKLPESLSRAIHKLCEGEAKVVQRRI